MWSSSGSATFVCSKVSLSARCDPICRTRTTSTPSIDALGACSARRSRVPLLGTTSSNIRELKFSSSHCTKRSKGTTAGPIRRLCGAGKSTKRRASEEFRSRLKKIKKTKMTTRKHRRTLSSLERRAPLESVEARNSRKVPAVWPNAPSRTLHR
uniref:(northern house mosquito) hypothetical protein n=1 Tax=Culex pipiens TaxID=7175 RepID=A0A8D8HIK5_CULPI